MNVLVALECSGIVRDAFLRAGHNAMSCDLKPTRRPGPHYQGDIRDVLGGNWDLMIAHPECTRLSNSGVRWLTKPPKSRSLESIWKEFEEGIELYLLLRNAPIEKKALENPVMNPYARERLGAPKRHIVQPWWFGDKAFKATGFELHGLPPLKATNKLVPPAKGTDEHKAWSLVHRCPPGPMRKEIRSNTFPGIAQAMAEQWGAV